MSAAQTGAEILGADAVKHMDTALPVYRTNEAVEELLQSLFARFNGANEALQPRLEAAHKDYYGYPIKEDQDDDVTPAMYFEGPSGHGKTTAWKVAAKKFAELMKMRPVFLPQERDAVGENDLYFNVISVGGALTRTDFDGLISKAKSEDGRDYMTHLPGWKLAKATDAGYAIILFDDFPTSSHQVQHGLLDLTLEGNNSSINFNKEGARRSGSSPVFIGFCGNVGVRDGNKINSITAATAGRIWRGHIEDNPHDWADRILQQFNDPVGDAYMSDFMRKRPEQFSQPPKDGVKGQYPSPRSWSQATSYARRHIYAAKQVDGAFSDGQESRRAIARIEKGVAGLVGKFCAQSYASFLKGIIIGAQPIADKLIRKGEVDADALQKKMGSGHSKDDLTFAFTFAVALAGSAAAELGEAYKRLGAKPSQAKKDDFDKELRRVSLNYGRGVFQLDPTACSLSVSALFKRLAVSCPGLYQKSHAHAFMQLPYLTTMAQEFFSTKNEFYNEGILKTVQDSLTQMGKFEGVGVRGLVSEIRGRATEKSINLG